MLRACQRAPLGLISGIGKTRNPVPPVEHRDSIAMPCPVHMHSHHPRTRWPSTALICRLAFLNPITPCFAAVGSGGGADAAGVAAHRDDRAATALHSTCRRPLPAA